jgi:hypothetical protein
MNKIVLIVVGIIVILVIVVVVFLNAFKGMGNPTGGQGPNYPYYITTQEITVKKILVPKGTKLMYEEQFFKEGEQKEIMNEAKLTSIELQNEATIDWGGVPVNMIVKFFNAEMHGYSVYADFNQIKENKKTKFSELWQNCNNDLGVLVTNTDDWSFNIKNISDISDCGVLYQRYFKEDKEQQKTLNELLSELKKVKINI